MILKSLQPINWGPFSTGQMLEVEPDVTVITGANDAGKSSLFRLLDAIYRWPQIMQNGIVETDLNIDYLSASTVPSWDLQESFGALATFSLGKTSGDAIRLPNGVTAVTGEDFTLQFNLSPKNRRCQIVQNGSVGQQVGLKMPHIIGLPTGHQLRDIVPLAAANHVEVRLLQVAFGSNFDAQKLKGLSKPIYNTTLTRARQTLKDAISQVIPPSMNLTIDLQPDGTTQENIQLQPIDLEYGYSPLTSRGKGVQTILQLLAGLLEANTIPDDLMIYVDEPETSLHADLQHLLRRLLEEIGKRPRVQVLYATHSPSMINNMRPHSVRLLSRHVDGERVITKISKRPSDRNFLALRTSLGITPSDSLLYAPVTIIVEGPTDAIGLGLLLPKMQKLGVVGFGTVEAILPQCHMIDGEGDSYLKQISLAISQKSSPVVFLDGDKKVSQDTRNTFANVPFILLDNQAEIEEIIDTDLYFQAMDKVLRQHSGFVADTVTYDAFEAWLINQEAAITKRAYTKRIEAWLRAKTTNPVWDKPAVLKTAIGLIDNPSQVKSEKLLELVQAIQQRLPSVR